MHAYQLLPVVRRRECSVESTRQMLCREFGLVMGTDDDVVRSSAEKSEGLSLGQVDSI
jgi:hypothetical protein